MDAHTVVDPFVTARDARDAAVQAARSEIIDALATESHEHDVLVAVMRWIREAGRVAVASTAVEYVRTGGELGGLVIYLRQAFLSGEVTDLDAIERRQGYLDEINAVATLVLQHA